MMSELMDKRDEIASEKSTVAWLEAVIAVKEEMQDKLMKEAQLALVEKMEQQQATLVEKMEQQQVALVEKLEQQQLRH